MECLASTSSTSMFVFVTGLLCLLNVHTVLSGELTFELPDNERMCFFESIKEGLKSTLEFQVITGGSYDVDMELSAPSGQILYKDTKKQYDTFTWTADQTGVYKFCFSNEFSTFSHKVVYFDFQVGDKPPLTADIDSHATALTLMESSAVVNHEHLNQIVDYQTHFRLRESQTRSFAEDLNERVLYWSVGQSLVILIITVGQVLIMKSFFTDKREVKT
ncbi:transmembrane emp24 domain-containing protein 7 isoform X2 [Octopus sinensis]|uniref:Transmembrane emp24 domain-containing protein 7 isoform X2 n=1 Tax=Octopus sinensis TaxID=2607531 RepID=A0A6P7T2Q0_9MOLL|nr:transmembrane emp24 domain-containing protein 7 isoform X2 [Octopus sinensis]